MEEKQFKIEELRLQKRAFWLQFLTFIAGGFGFFIIAQINSNYVIRQQEHLQNREFYKSVITDRLDIYKNACSKAGEIVNLAETQNPELVAKINDFEKFYWGEFSLIEDTNVLETARRFRESCQDFVKYSDKNTVKKIKYCVMDFTSACRESSIGSWGKLLKKDTTNF